MTLALEMRHSVFDAQPAFVVSGSGEDTHAQLCYVGVKRPGDKITQKMRPSC